MQNDRPNNPIDSKMNPDIARDLAVAALENCKDLLKSAELLQKGGMNGHAFGLLTIASEEFAKAHMYSEIVKGRKVYIEKGKKGSETISRFDLTDHQRKDEVFAELIILDILLPLILAYYIADSRLDLIDWEYFNPEDYQRYVDFFTNMSPEHAADIIDPSGKSGKRMDVLTTLAVRLGRDKNDGFYVDFRGGTIVKPSSISEGDYNGLHQTIDRLLKSHEKVIRDSTHENTERTFSKEVKKGISHILKGKNKNDEM